MHSFHYRHGTLFAEDVSLAALAAAHGTPLYVYSAATILDHYRRLSAALAGVPHLICYAVKANSNIGVLSLLAGEGSGFDIVSAGELRRVQRAGGDAALCSFAGVGKTDAEIRAALEAGILCFNAESEGELAAINRVAGTLGLRAPVAVRVNPDVDAHTHAKITTGKSENKFGVAFGRVEALYEAAARLPHLRLAGVQMHIGSQITAAAPFAEAVEKLAPLAERLKARHGIAHLSVGGGLGIIYNPALASGSPGWWADPTRRNEDGQPLLTVAAYARAVLPAVRALGLRLIVEPGRFIVGNAGVLLTRALYTKSTESKKFVVVDAAMNDLIRPALYESYHEIIPVAQPAATGTAEPAATGTAEPATPEPAAPAAPEPVGVVASEPVSCAAPEPVSCAAPEPVDIVGPVCESGDVFAQARPLPPVAPGDLLALMSAGAYGAAMASNYNSRPIPAEVLVQGAQTALIRRRQTPEDLWRDESLPVW